MRFVRVDSSLMSSNMIHKKLWFVENEIVCSRQHGGFSCVTPNERFFKTPPPRPQPSSSLLLTTSKTLNANCETGWQHEYHFPRL